MPACWIASHFASLDDPQLIVADISSPVSWGAIASGVALIVAGVAFLRWHRQTWHAQRADESLAKEDRHHFRRQYLRRTQVAILFIILGVMIPVGTSGIDWGGRPAWAAVYWIIVLFVAGWVLLLAMSDLLSLRVHSRAELTRVRKKQRELERQLLEMKSRKKNGRPKE